MVKKLYLGLVLAILLSLVAGVAIAQEEVRGSIRGTVYNDLNGDGKCGSTTGEPTVVGVPIEFVSNDRKTVVYLETGDDGTYGLVAAGLGTWSVSAKPSSDWIVTSANPLSVFLGTDQRLVLGVDFCIAKVGTIITVLPKSGAGLAPALLASFLVGGTFVAAGLALEVKRRRSS